MSLGSQNKFYIIILIIVFQFIAPSSNADNVEGYAVTLGALNKITAKFTEFDILVGKSKKYGSLKITIYKCEKRPPEEIPEDFVLLKIEDELIENNSINFFSGWMISSSPSLSPLEHPTYDIWVKDCKIRG
tara:strand:- start:868 stop:1260 length:393 start_codon:yes stop_codon:yes gene_type:complete